MKNCFQFLTYSGFYITTSRGYHIVIDPFLDQNHDTRFSSEEFQNVDLVLVTHGAFDHVGDAGKIAKRTGAWVLCPDDVKALLLSQGVPQSQIYALPWGMEMDFGSVRVRPIENHHRTVIHLPEDGYIASQPLAFLISLEDGTRVYVAGDTAIFSDMKLQGQLYRPHIGLINAVTETAEKTEKREIPCICTGEMSPYEAALCTKWLGLEAVIPCHHIDPRANPQISAFVTHLQVLDRQAQEKTKVAVLADGEVFWYAAEETG